MWSALSSFLVLIAGILLTSCSSGPELSGVQTTRGRVESTVSSVTSGTVEAEQVAELAFGTVGRVQSVRVHEGSQAKKGDILAELENADLLTTLRTAQSEFDRRERLYREHALSPSDRETAERVLDIARAAYEKSLIRAPFDGLIAEMHLEVGQLSQITAVIPQPLIRIVDIAPRYVKAQFDEVDLSRISIGLPARVKILAVQRTPLNAKVRKIVPYISTMREQDRTVEVELDILDARSLLPVGASADVEVITEARDDTLCIPSRVLFGRGSKRSVYVQDGARARKLEVEVGLSNYDRSEILGGLSAGQVVLYPCDNCELSDGAKIRTTVRPWP